MSKQTSEFPDKESTRAGTSRGRKRKGNFVLWEFWRLRPHRLWKSSWRRVRAYDTLEKAVAVKKKLMREWGRLFHRTYKIVSAGEEPADKHCEDWNKHRDQDKQE